MRLRHMLPTAAVTAGAGLLAAGGLAVATAGDGPSSGQPTRDAQAVRDPQMREMHRQMRDMHREHMRDPEMREMHRRHMRDPEMREMHREMMSMGSMMGSMGAQ